MAEEREKKLTKIQNKIKIMSLHNFSHERFSNGERITPKAIGLGAYFLVFLMLLLHFYTILWYCMTLIVVSIWLINLTLVMRYCILSDLHIKVYSFTLNHWHGEYFFLFLYVKCIKSQSFKLFCRLNLFSICVCG